MHYNFDQIIDRKNSNSVKWEFMHTLARDVNEGTLPFWIADMDFACPPAMLAAIKDRADRLIMGYSMADENYHQSVCNWMQRRFNWQIAADAVCISAGVVPALKDLLLTLTSQSDGVIIQRPVYYPFSAIIKLTGRTLVNNALLNSNGCYSIDFQDLAEKAKDPANTMMILCSPHNPVGRVWTKQELLRIGKICLENDVILVSDEIHCDLLRTGVSHTPVARLFPDQDSIITCTAPSKTFNSAGLQISNIIINKRTFREKWRHQTGPELPSPLALAATTAAYDEGEEWLEQLLVYLDDNFTFMDAFLKDNLPGVQFRIPEGTYLAWLDFRSYACNDKELAGILLKKANVLLEGGTMFGPEGSGFQRLNIACPRSTLEQGLTRIAAALQAA